MSENNSPKNEIILQIKNSLLILYAGCFVAGIVFYVLIVYWMSNVLSLFFDFGDGLPFLTAITVSITKLTVNNGLELLVVYTVAIGLICLMVRARSVNLSVEAQEKRAKRIISFTILGLPVVLIALILLFVISAYLPLFKLGSTIS